MGATTIWERWNSVLPNGLVSDTGMNSMNHYSYGAVMEWMYRYMCGIQPKEEAPGFKRVLLRPMPDARFDHASAWYNSAAGKYVSGWKKTETGMEYEVTVPFDAEAEFILEDRGSAVTLNGEPCAALAETGRITLPAGSYTVAVTTENRAREIVRAVPRR
jgi:alpha-L-rhamnosidase